MASSWIKKKSLCLAQCLCSHTRSLSLTLWSHRHCYSPPGRCGSLRSLFSGSLSGPSFRRDGLGLAPLPGLSLCPLGPLEAAPASGAGDPHFIWPFALRFSLGWGPAGEAPRRQLGFQRTGVIFKACLPCVCADKGCLCRESTTYTVGPMQISANDNIIIRLRKQRQ